MYAKKFMSLSLFHYSLLLLGSVYCSVISAQSIEFEFATGQEKYQYSVIQAGENFNFKFKKNLIDEKTMLKAGYHVLQSVYKDSSINKTYSEGYIRERARCFMVDSNFHTYTLCFLPNEFNQKNKDQLWGFVTQMPNWKWLVTRFFLPVLLIYVLFFYVFRRKDTKEIIPS